MASFCKFSYTLPTSTLIFDMQSSLRIFRTLTSDRPWDLDWINDRDQEQAAGQLTASSMLLDVINENHSNVPGPEIDASDAIYLNEEDFYDDDGHFSSFGNGNDSSNLISVSALLSINRTLT